RLLRRDARGEPHGVSQDRRAGARRCRCGQPAAERARAREGEPEGADRALDGVDVEPDEPPRQVADQRHGAALPRSTDRRDGRGGKVGRVLAPALEEAGHELVELDAADAAIDFTAPDAVVPNMLAALDAGVPGVIGTSGADLAPVDERARERGLSVFFAPTSR